MLQRLGASGPVEKDGLSLRCCRKHGSQRLPCQPFEIYYPAAHERGALAGGGMVGAGRPRGGWGSIDDHSRGTFLGPVLEASDLVCPSASCINTKFSHMLENLETAHSLSRLPPPGSSPSHSPSTRRSQTLDRPDRLVQQKLRHTELGTENPYIHTYRKSISISPAPCLG